MEYIELGKIAYSNEVEFIGSYLKVSEQNFKMIEKGMNEFIKADFGGFDKCKNDFFYHLFQHTVPNIDKYDLIKKFNYKVFVYYSFNISFPFELYYSDIGTKLIEPVIIYEKELIELGNK